MVLTAAGRALLVDAPWSLRHLPGDPLMADHILAIEQEAAAAERARLRGLVEGLLDSPAVYPAFMGATIRAENDIVRAVLALLAEPER